MANSVTLKGFFGPKEAYSVAAPSAGDWYAGQLFKLTSIPSGTDADYYVAVNDSSGSAVLGVALENASDASSPVYGMTHPSGSKVTILHGHSKFEIVNAAGTKCYEDDVESASLMDLLYCSGNGKWSTFQGSSSPHAIGFVTRVPSASNSYTLGVVLFG